MAGTVTVSALQESLVEGCQVPQTSIAIAIPGPQPLRTISLAARDTAANTAVFP